MVDTIEHMHHKPPRTIYEIQMAKNYKLYGLGSLHHPLKELTNLMLPLQTSLPNIQKQIHNQHDSPQWETNSSKIASRTKHF